MKKLHIAIDGPAGAGKSTIARLLSRRIKVDYLDTGAMYRALTYHVLDRHIDVEDENEVVREAEKIKIDFVDNSIYLNGTNVDKEIRSRSVSKYVSVVSKHPKVRYIMVKKQQEIARRKSVIMDGRDIGTVVLPRADYKFYLDASIEIRAKRRLMEMENNQDVVFESIKDEIAARDEMDKNRKISPLKKAEDAIVIDTSNMTIEEVLNKMENIIYNKGGE